MGWGTSLWMNWKQKKRRDRSHAKSSPFRELLQILFYGNSAPGRTLQKSTDDKVDRAFPIGNALFFFVCMMSLFRLRKRGLVGARLLHLAGTSPLGKKKHKALYDDKVYKNRIKTII